MKKAAIEGPFEEEHVLTRDQKLERYGDGPWLDEPDACKWIAYGYPCEVLRELESGHLCGYVTVPDGHPWFGRGDEDLDVETHHGITYSAASPAGWTLGFDCAHYGDMMPGVIKLVGRSPRANEVYADFAWVSNETERLAEQAARVAR